MTVTPEWYAASAGPRAQSVMDCPQRSFPATPTGRASQRARVGVGPPPRRGRGFATKQSVIPRAGDNRAGTAAPGGSASGRKPDDIRAARRLAPAPIRPLSTLLPARVPIPLGDTDGGAVAAPQLSAALPVAIDRNAGGRLCLSCTALVIPLLTKALIDSAVHTGDQRPGAAHRPRRDRARHSTGSTELHPALGSASAYRHGTSHAPRPVRAPAAARRRVPRRVAVRSVAVPCHHRPVGDPAVRPASARSS